MGIIITKLANNNVEVSNIDQPYTLLPSMGIFRAKSTEPTIDGVEVQSEGKLLSRFTAIGVDQVVRQDGTIVAISDNDTLYYELKEFFFFEVSGGSGGGGTPVISSYVESISTSDWTLDGGRYYVDAVHNLNTKDLLIEAYNISTDDTEILDDYERTGVNTLRIWSLVNTSEYEVLISNGGSSTVIDSLTYGTEETGDFAPVGKGGVIIPVNSATDVTVTINTNSCEPGETVYFEQMGAGRILLTDGTLTSIPYAYGSYISGGVGSLIGSINMDGTRYKSIGDLQ